MVALVIGLLAVSVGVLTTRVTAPPTADPTGLAKIDHIVVIMQENRSFDSYFGMHPSPGRATRGRISPTSSTNST